MVTRGESPHDKPWNNLVQLRGCRGQEPVRLPGVWGRRRDRASSSTELDVQRTATFIDTPSSRLDPTRSRRRSRRATGTRAARAALLILVGAAALGSGAVRPVHADTATIQQFPVPTQAFLDPSGITRGPDGNLWFSEFGGQMIGRITPAGSMTEYPVSGNPTAVVTGGDGDVWFLESDVQKIGKVDPATGIVAEFAVPSLFYPQGDFQGLTLGPDGNVYFADSVYSIIGRITPGGVTTEVSVPGGPLDITTGADGNLWFGERTSQSIGRISTAFTNLAQFPLPPPGNGAQSRRAFGLTAGPDGNVWYTDIFANKVGFVTPSGVFTEFFVPYSGAAVAGITAGPDGNMWFTERFGNRVGRVTPSGVISEIHLPQALSFPEGITSGPDGALWFAENNLGFPGSIGRVARLDPATVVPKPAPCLTVTASTTLTHDVGPCPGDGIVVTGSSVTLDLGGHKVFAAPGPRVGDFAGVRLTGVSGDHVANGEVTGFDAGIVIDHGSANTVSGLNVHDNVSSPDPSNTLGDGIDIFHSASNRIVGNVVAHNGLFSGISVLGLGSDNNTIQGNSVHDNTDLGMGNSFDPGGGVGIVVNAFLESEAVGRGQSISGNDIIGNDVRNNVSSGISNDSNVGATIKGNTVDHNGFNPDGSQGNFPLNGIGLQHNQRATRFTNDVAIGNVVTNNANDGIQATNSGGNLIQGNTVTGSGRFGIEAQRRSVPNTIKGNTASGNTANDLNDDNPNCTYTFRYPPPSVTQSNTWSGNSFGTANQPCVGGSGQTSAANVSPQPSVAGSQTASPDPSLGNSPEPFSRGRRILEPVPGQ